MLNFKKHATLTFVLATTFSIQSYATELLQPEDYSRFNQTAYNALPLSAPLYNNLWDVIAYPDANTQKLRNSFGLSQAANLMIITIS